MVGFPCQYIYGTVLMKTGIRILMLAGSLIAGISFIFIVRVETLWAFYLFYTLLFIGLTMVAFGPLAWFIVKDWPEDMGLAPDGLPVISKPCTAGQIRHRVAPAADAQLQWPLAKLICTDIFRKLGLAFGIMMIGTVGVMSQLKPRFADIGFPP